MSPNTPSSGAGSPVGRGGRRSVPTDFETAQGDLFDAVDIATRSRFVDGPAGRIHVVEAGFPDDQPPVVFVHGTAAFGAFFAPLMTQVEDRRMIAFDRPGYGLSDAFVYTEANVRRTVVDVLLEVLDTMEADRIDLVGHSMGGQTAILFALMHPARVRRLVLIGAVVGFPGTHPPLRIRLLTVPVLNQVIRRLQKSGDEGVLDIAETFGERDAIRNHPAFIRAIAAHEAEPKSAEAGFSEFNALVSVRGWRPSVRLSPDELRSIQPPTTIVWGENDTLGGPDDVRDGVALISDVRFETVDAGHIPFLDHPNRCTALLK
jgi:pimeloyl-ACP methyl ester carboxylesterase